MHLLAIYLSTNRQDLFFLLKKNSCFVLMSTLRNPEVGRQLIQWIYHTDMRPWVEIHLIHTGNWARQLTLVILALGRWRQEGPKGLLVRPFSNLVKSLHCKLYERQRQTKQNKVESSWEKNPTLTSDLHMYAYTCTRTRLHRHEQIHTHIHVHAHTRIETEHSKAI